MHDLQGIVDYLNLSVRDTHDFEPHADWIATLHVEKLFTAFVLNDGGVVESGFGDEADIIEIRRRRRCHVERDQVRVEPSIGRSNFHLTHTGIRDQALRHSREQLLRAYKPSWQISPIDKNMNRRREIVSGYL